MTISWGAEPPVVGAVPVADAPVPVLPVAPSDAPAVGFVAAVFVVPDIEKLKVEDQRFEIKGEMIRFELSHELRPDVSDLLYLANHQAHNL